MNIWVLRPSKIRRVYHWTSKRWPACLTTVMWRTQLCSWNVEILPWWYFQASFTIYLALSLPRSRAEVPVFPGVIGGMSSLLPPSTHLAPAAAWSALLTSQMTHTSLATQRGLPLRPRTSSGPARPFPHHNYLQDTGHRMNTKYFVRCAFIL